MAIDPPEITIVDDDVETVGCDGGGGALGHPMTYYSFGTHDYVECSYCDRRFVKRRAAATAAGGVAATGTAA